MHDIWLHVSNNEEGGEMYADMHNLKEIRLGPRGINIRGYDGLTRSEDVTLEAWTANCLSTHIVA